MTKVIFPKVVNLDELGSMHTDISKLCELESFTGEDDETIVVVTDHQGYIEGYHTRKLIYDEGKFRFDPNNFYSVDELRD